MSDHPPIISQQTRVVLDSWKQHRPAVALILGHQARNEVAVARYLIDLLQQSSQATTVLEYHQPTIDEVRKLQRDIRTTNPRGRIVAIFALHAMKHESLNALLKTLEEPQSQTSFVLTAADATTIPSTIRSRSTELALSAPTQADFTSYYGNQHDVSLLAAAYAASGGATDAFERYLEGNTEDIAVAKQILTETPYQRLKRISAYSSDRDSAQSLVAAILRTVQYLLRNDTKQRQKWLQAAQLCDECRVALSENASVKLTLTRLFAHL